MAKISAYVDGEQARWRRTASSNREAPYEMLLTHGGRVLYKAERDAKWVVRRGRGSSDSPGRVSMAQALAQASVFGMERVR